MGFPRKPQNLGLLRGFHLPCLCPAQSSLRRSPKRRAAVPFVSNISSLSRILGALVMAAN